MKIITKEVTDAIEQSIEHYGREHRIDQCIEECSELIQALLKNRRFPECAEHYSNVLEEIADVTIMVESMRRLFDSDTEAVAHIAEGKAQRLVRRMADGYN